MAEPILRLFNLTKRFGALQATDSVSLDLWPGEIHALIGPNGAGKSTLVKLIVGELRQNSGSIEFEGRCIDALGSAERASRGLARSFQVSSIFPEFTVFENVFLAVQGAERKTYRFFRRALSNSEFSGRASAQIDRVRLSARSGTVASELSHGERRRLEVAMALAMRPKALLLDEPMAGVGAEGTRELTKLLSEIREESPILLIEHDMDAVFALADRISVLVSGRVVSTGGVAEIRRSDEVRRAYLGFGDE
ncbi:MAG: ABC transporter ATP-binding protein [Albidovulum sp.]|nr:ABC transporter ATP-binding protein [Albidovulum sp.]MDE0533056.1 ABC transporter ATP-binding protein [Albidovulum sp.]